jgi:hypothetical protein
MFQAKNEKKNLLPSPTSELQNQGGKLPLKSGQNTDFGGALALRFAWLRCSKAFLLESFIDRVSFSRSL